MSETRTRLLVHSKRKLCYDYGGDSILSILGRLSFVRESCCSAPLPLPLATEQLSNELLDSQAYQLARAADADQDIFSSALITSDPANAGSYLTSKVRVDIIMQKAMMELYSTTAIAKSWRDVQLSISRLRAELEAWSTSFSFAMDFVQMNADTNFLGARLRLEMLYIGAKILITRPCLCRLDNRTANQPGAPGNFTNQAAQVYIGAAKAIVDLLPDHTDATYLYNAGPWRSVVYNLMQALIILLLEMSYGTVYFPDDGKEILVSVKKLIRCLRALAANNEVVQRARTVAFGALPELTLTRKVDLSDLIMEDIV